MLAAESQHVIALRLQKFACGGPDAHFEAHRMVAEKIVALAETAYAIATGANAEEIVHDFRRRVGANARRLAEG
ncbi:MAG: hypothetical protein IT548_00600 [Alphaproteobacteria bacterium]|nr:hypothetical protein [Alphaproteobacteria bacterium]